MASLLQSGTRIAGSSARATPSGTSTRLRNSLIVLLAANAILIFFLFRAPGASEAERHAEIASLQAEERAARERVEKLRDLQQKAQAATENERDVVSANVLQSSSASLQILAELDRLAKENGLEAGGITYTPNQEANGLGWTNVTASVSVEGEYPNLVRFINDLEKSGLFWIIQSLDVSGQTGSELRLNLHAAT